MDVCCMFYHRVNDDVFETAVKTFRKHSDALLQVYTDMPKDLQEQFDFRKSYGIQWMPLEPSQVKNRRCLCKMECVQDCLSRLSDGDRVAVCDVDLYFLDDPFTAFDKCDFGIGLTTRFHPYKFPINAGVYFINVSEWSKKIMGLHFNEYAQKHPDTHDWFVDQDYLLTLWSKNDSGIKDVGWEYNFCPNTDVFGIDFAASLIKRAYESRSVKILHLKSELKMCIYDGFLEDAVNNCGVGIWNWKKEGA